MLPGRSGQQYTPRGNSQQSSAVTTPIQQLQSSCFFSPITDSQTMNAHNKLANHTILSDETSSQENTHLLAILQTQTQSMLAFNQASQTQNQSYQSQQEEQQVQYDVSIESVPSKPSIKSSSHPTTNNTEQCSYTSEIIPIRSEQSTSYNPYVTDSQSDSFFLQCLKRKEQELTQSMKYSIIHESSTENLLTRKDSSPNERDEYEDTLFTFAAKRKKKKSHPEANDKKSKIKADKILQQYTERQSINGPNSSLDLPGHLSSLPTTELQHLNFEEYLMNFESQYQKNATNLLRRSVKLKKAAPQPKLDSLEQKSTRVVHEQEQLGNLFERKWGRRRRLSSSSMTIIDQQFCSEKREESQTVPAPNENPFRDAQKSTSREQTPSRILPQLGSDSVSSELKSNDSSSEGKHRLFKKLQPLSSRRESDHSYFPLALTSCRNRNTNNDEAKSMIPHYPPIGQTIRMSLAKKYFRKQDNLVLEASPMQSSYENAIIQQQNAARMASINTQLKTSGQSDTLDSQQDSKSVQHSAGSPRRKIKLRKKENKGHAQFTQLTQFTEDTNCDTLKFKRSINANKENYDVSVTPKPGQTRARSEGRRRVLLSINKLI